MNAPILAMCIFCVSVWYLFSDAGWSSGGMPGAVALSPGLNALPYCCWSGGPDQFCGTFRLKLVNFNRANCCIMVACGAGMSGLHYTEAALLRFLAGADVVNAIGCGA